MNTLVEYNLSNISPSPFNRERAKRYSPAQLEALAKNIAELEQVIEPAIVRPKPGGEPDEVELVAGERRWRASQLAGRETLPCILRDLTDRQVCDIMLSENLQRENLTPIEEACVFADMLQAKDGQGAAIYPTMDALFEVTGKKRDVIENRLKLLNCPEFLLAAIDAGEVAARVGEMIGRVPDASQRAEAAKRAMKSQYREGPMTVKEAAVMLQRDFMMSLNNCGFDTEDANLVPEVCVEGVRIEGGSCENCPWRSGSNTAIQSTLTEGGDGGNSRGFDANVCTNTRCFGLKQAAASRAIQKDAEDRGLRVMPKEKAKKLLKGHNSDLDVYIADGDKYVAQDEQPGHEHTGHFANDEFATWGELLEGEKVSWLIVKDGKKTRYFLESDIAVETVDAKRRKAGEPLLFKKGRKATEEAESLPSTSGLSEMSPREEAQELSLDGGDGSPPPASSAPANSSPSSVDLEVRNFKVTVVALDKLTDAWNTGGIPKESALDMLRLVLETTPCDIEVVCDVLGIDYEPGKGVPTIIDYARNAFDGRQIAMAAYMALVAGDIEANGIDDAEVSQRLFERHGVDLVKVRKLVDDAEAQATKTPFDKAIDDLHEVVRNAGYSDDEIQAWLDALADDRGFIKSTDPKAGTQDIYCLIRAAKNEIKEKGRKPQDTPEFPIMAEVPRVEPKPVEEAPENPTEEVSSPPVGQDSPPLPFGETYTGAFDGPSLWALVAKNGRKSASFAEVIEALQASGLTEAQVDDAIPLITQLDFIKVDGDMSYTDTREDAPAPQAKPVKAKATKKAAPKPATKKAAKPAPKKAPAKKVAAKKSVKGSGKKGARS